MKAGVLEEKQKIKINNLPLLLPGHQLNQIHFGSHAPWNPIIIILKSSLKQS